MLDPSSTSREPLALPGLMRMSPQASALMRLPLSACRWPMGQSWCGRPAAQGAYCHGHHLRSRNTRSLMRLVGDVSVNGDVLIQRLAIVGHHHRRSWGRLPRSPTL